MRHELRVRKRERYLRAARHILVRDGLEALTMQAIASEVGAAVGTIYGYFPSKQSLVAELQLEAIRTMLDAWSEANDLWMGRIAAGPISTEELPIARYIAFAEFFVRSQTDFAFEFGLYQLRIDASREIFEAVDAAGNNLVERRYLAGPAAVVEGVMRAAGRDPSPGAIIETVSALLLSLYGISLLAKAWPGAETFAVPQLSRRVFADMACGWGVDYPAIKRIWPIVHETVEARPLTSMSTYRCRSLESTEDDAPFPLPTSA